MTTTNDNAMHTIGRTGLPPIKFRGEMIGSGSTRRHDSDRWTTVRIYRTAAGRYIYQVSNLTCWDGERDYFTAGSCASSAEVIAALKDDNGYLGAASQEACEEATKADPAFIFEEVID